MTAIEISSSEDLYEMTYQIEYACDVMEALVQRRNSYFLFSYLRSGNTVVVCITLVVQWFE